MSSTPTPGSSAADNERYVLFELQCCIQEMNSALKIIDKSLNKLLDNMEALGRRKRRKEKVESHYYADALPGATLEFS